MTGVLSLFSVNSKSIQNWKQKLIIWNDISSAEISDLSNCYLRTFVILWLVCLYCSNTNLYVFVNLSLLLHHVSMFLLERLYILLKRQRPALIVQVIRCKTDIYILGSQEAFLWWGGGLSKNVGHHG